MLSVERQETVITDIKMPFWSMVTFMVKWAVAAIPAAIILFFAGIGFLIIGTVIMAAFGLSLEGLQNIQK